MSRSQPTRKFADPWGFRRSSQSTEPIADLHGRPVLPRLYRRGGVQAVVAILEGEHDDDRHQLSRLMESGSWLRRRQSAAFARYRLAGHCTQVELRTIEGLWFEGISLRALAGREQVSPAAIGARISGLRYKAPEFWNWWRVKNQHHRRSG